MYKWFRRLEKIFFNRFLFFSWISSLVCFSLQLHSRQGGTGARACRTEAAGAGPRLRQGVCQKQPGLTWSCRSSDLARLLPTLCWISHAFKSVQIHFGLLKLAANHLLLFIMVKYRFVKHREPSEPLGAAQVGRSCSQQAANGTLFQHPGLLERSRSWFNTQQQ